MLRYGRKIDEDSNDLLKPITSAPSARALAINEAPANELEPNTANRLYFVKIKPIFK